jgi:predicted amidohydrolase
MNVRVAACQIDPVLGEVDRNLERIERALQEAAQAGVQLAVLPEAALTGYAYSSLDEAMAPARRARAVGVDRLSELAQQHEMSVICGSLEPEADQIYNVAYVLAADGQRFRYAKTHLPFLGIDRFATPGPDAPAVYELDGVRVGVLICYDLRFPEAARVCALDGADLIALPTNWPVGVEFHPDLFAPARAAENHCYVLACDRVGTERGTTFLGRSVLIDCNGQQLAVASDVEEELLVGEIDPEAARATRVRRIPGEHEWDTIADRRPGLYDRLLSPGADREHPPSASLFSGDAE